MTNVGARWALAAMGTASALIAAEGLAYVADRGAFPFLDLYEPDATYGVRLAARAHTRVRTRSGRVVHVHTNALGLRDSGPIPARGAVLLLGDSQVFGYGVGDHDAMAARLVARGVPALAVAVPSWGPEESARAAEALTPALHPRALVFFAHTGNDWLEAEVPNVERSDARDGWLVRRRREPAGWAAPRWFARSHLWFTVRALEAERLARRSGERALGLGAPAADAMLATLAHLAPSAGPHRSRLTRHLLRAHAACAGECRVLLAVLPMDVEVDRAAWAKYGATPRDLSALRALPAALVADAQDAGIEAVDLGVALAAASPGAYLDDDPHLSPRGHDAVAAALAPRLAAGALARGEVAP